MGTKDHVFMQANFSLSVCVYECVSFGTLGTEHRSESQSRHTMLLQPVFHSFHTGSECPAPVLMLLSIPVY